MWLVASCKFNAHEPPILNELKRRYSDMSKVDVKLFLAANS